MGKHGCGGGGTARSSRTTHSEQPAQHKQGRPTSGPGGGSGDALNRVVLLKQCSATPRAVKHSVSLDVRTSAADRWAGKTSVRHLLFGCFVFGDFHTFKMI